jgi:dihydroflavonol-4-reductase
VTADVAITGGTGLVGGHLLSALVASGRSVTALVRSREAADAASAAGALPVVVDLFDHDGLRTALWGHERLFHVAGVNETCPRDPENMDRINIDGTRAVVAAAADAGVGRVIHTSSAAAVGEAEGMIATEATVHTGTYSSRYARSKHLGEVAALDEAARRGVDLVVVSPSSVQGPGRSSGSARLVLYALRSHRPVLFDTTVSIIDIEDSTRGHIAAAERGRPGQRYLLSGATMSVREILTIAHDVMQIPIRPRWVSEGVVRILGTPLAAGASVVRPGAGICPELVATLLHGHRVDGSRAERDLGLRYTPFRDSLARTIEWFVATGLIARR